MHKMTENQLFPMSADIFDTSSNSSNPLKYDIYSTLGLSNSNSPNTLFGNFSPTHQLSLNTLNTNNSCQNAISSAGVGNVLLTNAISIPRSNNPNQCHNSYNINDIHHYPSPSPLQQQLMAAQQQQQQQQHQHHHHQQQQQQQQLQPQIHARLLAELSDYGLDALDASLSPTLLQDVSLNSTSPLHSININGNLSVTLASNNVENSSYYVQDASSPIGIGNSDSNSVTPDASLLLTALDDVNVDGNSVSDNANAALIYDVLESDAVCRGVNGNMDNVNSSNNLWSEISNAIIAKNEPPFSIDDEYILTTDKADLQAAGFADINDDSFLQGMMGSIDDLLPPTVNTDMQCDLLSQLNHEQISPNTLPMDLLQQQKQQQFAQLQILSQQQQQQQAQNNSPVGAGASANGGGNGVSNGGGAIHHTHTRHNSSSPYEIYHSTPNKQQQQQHHLNPNAFSPGSQPSQSPLQLNSITPPPHANRLHYQQNMVKSRNMQDLLKKGFSMSPDRTLLGQSVPNSQMILTGTALSPSSGSSGFGSAATAGSIGSGSARKSLAYQQNENASISRLSSSAPTHLGFEHLWMRREPRQHLLSTGSLAEAESISSLSTGSVLSPDAVDFSQEDDEDDATTDYNSDNYDDFSSDNGSDYEDDSRTGGSNQFSSSKGKERYFWQYNVQAKGPKGKRLVFQSKLEDPHVLNEATDPVFSPNCSVRGIKVFKHSGKARKGDGNDLTPNARKLQSIGRELDKLNRTINDMTPVSELPYNVRPTSRKEKNKLASRACRLKKKAQHEANKIKRFGLELEHKRLLNGIAEMKQALALKYANLHSTEHKEEIDQQIEHIYCKAKAGVHVAGISTEFVNKVLENVKSGIPNGGLDELKNS